MITVSKPTQLREAIAYLPRPHVLVPTMGALHFGHRSLLRRARQEAGSAGTVIASIFVNPIQFDRSEDLESYPTPLELDLQACRDEGVDVIFSPSTQEMYAADRSVTVTETLLSAGLCGAKRPGHFDGVCTVVLKLFLITRCDIAVFGEKDFQQLAVIRRMVRDLDVPVTIVAAPTVREADGLAMSSRNVRLSDAERAEAPKIYQALQSASQLNVPATIIERARELIESSPLARIDYLELVDSETLTPLSRLDREGILAVAVYFGDVRLIDHVTLQAR